MSSSKRTFRKHTDSHLEIPIYRSNKSPIWWDLVYLMQCHEFAFHILTSLSSLVDAKKSPFLSKHIDLMESPCTGRSVILWQTTGLSSLELWIRKMKLSPKFKVLSSLHRQMHNHPLFWTALWINSSPICKLFLSNFSNLKVGALSSTNRNSRLLTGSQIWCQAIVAWVCA